MAKSYLSPLHCAVAYNDENHVKFLLKSGTPVNTKDFQSGFTPLHMSVQGKKPRMTLLLLQNDADPNEIENFHRTPLHLAVRNCSKELVKLLLEHKADPNRKIKYNGKTPLYMAVEQNCKSIAKILLKYGASVCQSVSEGKTLLNLVLQKTDEKLAYLIAKHSCTSVVNTIDFETGCAPIHLAVNKRFYKVVKALIKKKANVNEMTTSYLDPLQLAVMRGDLKMVKLLVQNGARMNRTSYGLCLHYAVSYKFKDIVELLLDSKVAHIDEYDSEGLTALQVAVINDYQDMAELCIKRGADPNAKCRTHGFSVLYYAVEKGNRKMVKVLLDAGAMAHEYVCECSTLLDNAIEWRYDEVVRLLLERGALIDFSRDDDQIGFKMAIKWLAEFTSRNSTQTTKVAKKNYEAIAEHEFGNQYYDSCLSELETMKKLKIFKDVTFHDLLTKDENTLAIWARNEELTQRLPRSGYKTRFATYATKLSLNFAKARVRAALIDEALKKFDHIGKYRLPMLCSQEVIKNLTNEEIKNFIMASCRCRLYHDCLPEMTLIF